MKITQILASIATQSAAVLNSKLPAGAPPVEVILTEMPLKRQKDEDDVPTDWLSAWYDDYRIKVTMHLDVLKVIQDSKVVTVNADGSTTKVFNYDKLFIMKPKVDAPRLVVAHPDKDGKEVADYLNFIVINPDIEENLI